MRDNTTFRQLSLKICRIHFKNNRCVFEQKTKQIRKMPQLHFEIFCPAKILQSGNPIHLGDLVEGATQLEQKKPENLFQCEHRKQLKLKHKKTVKNA